jgi:O-antigen ligase
MSDTQRRWLERGGWLAAFLLPLFFNPLALDDPFEPGKVWLFRFIVLGMAGVAAWPGKGRGAWSNPLAVPVVAYGVMVGLATAVSINVQTSLWARHGAVTILAALLFFFLLTAALGHRRQVEDLFSVILIGSVPVALYGLIQYLGFDPIAWQNESVSPIHATMGRSLYLGSYLAMIMPFTMVRLIQHHAPGQRKRQIALGFVLMLQVACLLVTLARGAWLGFLGGMVLFALLLIRQRRTRLWTIVALIVMGLAVLGFIARSGWVIFDEAAAPFSGDLGRIREASDNARLTTWADALALVPARWLLGYGPETYATAVTQRLGVITGPYTSHLPDPHNLLLHQATAVGLAGLLAFLWVNGRFYVLLLAQFRRANDADTRLLLAAILRSTTAYLIQAQFNPDMITLSVLFWINLSMGIVLLRQQVTTDNNN